MPPAPRAPKWDECANPACLKIFDNRNDSQCCSLSCARFMQWQNTDHKRFSARFASFLDQPEIGDPEAVERAFWRVFARRY